MTCIFIAALQTCYADIALFYFGVIESFWCWYLSFNAVHAVHPANNDISE